jgi:tetratricopeptide (TPR) repeat protein/cellulose biosynthesis protein BcsQ
VSDLFPLIYTFYSFKGGVGRSMALINVAYVLAARGRAVLVLDMDLEAPGLSGFLLRQEELGRLPPCDMLDLVAWASRTVEEVAEGPHDESLFPHLGDFASGVKPEKIAPLRPRLGELGRIDIIPIDESRDYYRRLDRLRVRDLDRGGMMRIGEVLRVWLKGRRHPLEAPDYYGAEAPREAPYDYVLIDSRTGVTEIGGLCIGPLSDRLVVLTALNDQNVQGSRQFLSEVGISYRPAAEFKPWDEADAPPRGAEAPRRLAPKPTLLVASPVPLGETDLKRDRLRCLEKEIGPVVCQLPYHPRMALREYLFVRQYPEEPLAPAYLSLADQIQEAARDTFGHLFRTIDEKLRQTVPATGLPKTGRAILADEGARLAPAVRSTLTDLQQSLRLVPLAPPEFAETQLALVLRSFQPQTEEDFREADRAYRLLTGAGAEDRASSWTGWGILLGNWALRRQDRGGKEWLFRQAYECLDQALRIKPNDHWALNVWGVTLCDEARMRSGEEAERLLVEACGKFEQALRSKPGFSEALNNWGTALADLARGRSGEEAERLLVEACGKFEQALRSNPYAPYVLTNWGSALRQKARGRSGEEAERLLAEAWGKYETAFRIKPDDYETLYNWGTALFEQVRQTRGRSEEEAERLLAEACGKYEQALRIKPDYHEALTNWGSALADQARNRSGEEAERLLAEACSKYEQALRIKPDSYEALNNWGLALSQQARSQAGNEVERWLAEAYDKYERGLQIAPTDPNLLYNRACLEARQGRVPEAVSDLERWLRTDPPRPRKTIDADEDFGPIRDTPLFQRFLQSLPADR